MLLRSSPYEQDTWCKLVSARSCTSHTAHAGYQCKHLSDRLSTLRYAKGFMLKDGQQQQSILRRTDETSPVGILSNLRTVLNNSVGPWAGRVTVLGGARAILGRLGLSQGGTRRPRSGLEAILGRSWVILG